MSRIDGMRTVPENPRQPLVEVTLQSLNGVVISTTTNTTKTATTARVPKVTAAVAFSGSVKDMLVYSSFVCPRTGHLMVESEAAKPKQDESNKQKRHRRQQQQQQQQQQQSLSCKWSKTQIAPHAAIRLPHPHPRLPTLSLSQTNRDSRLVKELPPSLDDSEVSSEPGEADSSVWRSITLTENNTTDQNSTTFSLEKEMEEEEGRDDTDEPYDSLLGTSAIWSLDDTAAAAALPNIVELHISIRIDPDDWITTALSEGPHGASCHPWEVQEIYEVGIAYLVLSGNDEGAATVMDLPIKRIQKLPAPLSLQDQAFLRVKVRVFQEDPTPAPAPAPVSNDQDHDSSSKQRRRRKVTSKRDRCKDHVMHQEELGHPLVDTLQTAEERMHAHLLHSVVVTEDEFDAKNSKPQSHGCFGLLQLWQKALDEWVACDGCGNDDLQQKFDAFSNNNNRNGNNNNMVIRNNKADINQSFSSTIETASSFLYFDYYD